MGKHGEVKQAVHKLTKQDVRPRRCQFNRNYSWLMVLLLAVAALMVLLCRLPLSSLRERTVLTIKPRGLRWLPLRRSLTPTLYACTTSSRRKTQSCWCSSACAAVRLDRQRNCTPDYSYAHCGLLAWPLLPSHPSPFLHACRRAV